MNNRLIALLLILLSAGLFFGYVNPTWTGKVADTSAQIEDADQALIAAREYLARQDELVAKRNSLDQSSLSKLMILLPDSVDNVGLILSLNALAARSNLKISSIDVSNQNAASASNSGEAGGPVGSVELSLSASGSYSAFQTFLRGIERSQRLLDVKDLKITGTNNGTYNYSMSLRIYWLR